MTNHPKDIIGINLEKTRLLLMFPREFVAKKAGISSSSLERIEKNDPPIREGDKAKIISFYNLTEQELLDENFSFDWVQLTKRFKKRNPESVNLEYFNDLKLTPKQVIVYRAFTAKLLEKPISASELTKEIELRFHFKFAKNRVQNALRSLLKEKIITTTQTSPIKYLRLNKKFLKKIDPFFHLVIKLEEIYWKHQKDLVNSVRKILNPSFRKMALMLVFLKNGEKSRNELFNKAGMLNDTNNVVRTINILEKVELIKKTKIANTSSKQSYELTEKGVELLKELEM